MKNVSLIEVSNGYTVIVTNDSTPQTYIFKSTETLKMLEFIGQLIESKLVYVKI